MCHSDIDKIAADITNVRNVLADKHRSYEDLVSADVRVVDALADLERMTDLKRAEICIRAENVDAPAARIKNIWRNETVEERRLITISKEFKNILKNLLYREAR